MCTYSWCPGAGDGFELWFNRDEQKSRPGAEPPAEREIDGVRFLAPRDPKGGGTWIFANEAGLAACLLNLYGEDSRPGRPEIFGGLRSRGLLLWELASANSPSALAARLLSADLQPYSPFTIAVPRPRLEASDLHQWDGMRLTTALLPFGAPLTSSSFQFKEVATARSDTFGHLTGDEPPTAGTCNAFHHADGSGSPSAFTVLMDRADAQTHSISCARVNGGTVSFEYEEMAPDLAGEPITSYCQLGDDG